MRQVQDPHSNSARWGRGDPAGPIAGRHPGDRVCSTSTRMSTSAGVVRQPRPGWSSRGDRAAELVNQHRTLLFLGHATDWDETAYEYQTVVDTCVCCARCWRRSGSLVESGHRVAKKKRGEPLRGRCDSFVVETDVHYPTDVSLLWDAMRCLLRTTGRAAGKHGVRGWRQWRHLSREVQARHRVRATRRAQAHPERVEAYLHRCRALVARAETTRTGCRSAVARRQAAAQTIRTTRRSSRSLRITPAG